MAKAVVETFVNAPIEICFDLARDIDVHTQTVWAHTKERAVAGRTKGLIELGETVTFEATHFGIRQRLTSKIVEFEYPVLFTDQMQKGAFAHLKHTHLFEKSGANGTLMRDILEFGSPLGIIGRIFDYFVLENYMRRFIEARNEKLKELAEKNRNMQLS
ncbi:SRPBCC family protein [Paenibacillus contaminans]|uniref:Cell division protein n=1 Tax=Paenibacillus contaminans TaxID=450362 RepID=A0A329LJQ6_9BACL|nr:SRPBCC family protein [Paenibacillus contaminans]RAV08184.1 cell division protein [Paenibacillus contaminans]